MQIKEVEKLTGIKDVNIRYYEKEGLIHPGRQANGYREYSDKDVELIRKIKILWEIPVHDIKQILEGQANLRDVMIKRLYELNSEEVKIQDI